MARCSHKKTRVYKVIDLSSSAHGYARKRYRKCLACGRKFTTLEEHAVLIPAQLVRSSTAQARVKAQT